MNQLHLISISHKQVSQNKLSNYYLNQEGQSVLRSYLENHSAIQGFIILTTCNRQEIYFEANKDLRTEILNKWTTQIDSSKISKSFFRTFSGNFPVSKHLNTLVLGFHSAIQGDDQILGQVKKAFAQASERKNLSTLLERAFQSMCRLNKKVVNETTFRSHSVSLAYHTLSYLNSNYGLSNHSVIILGAGDMAQQVAKNLKKFNVKSVAISNRTFDKAKSLAQNFKNIEVLDFEFLHEYINDFNLVISCLSSAPELINDTMLKEKTEIKCIVDLSHEATVSNDIVTNIEIKNLLEFHKAIASNKINRGKCIPIVQRLITESSIEFHQWAFDYAQRKERSMQLELSA